MTIALRRSPGLVLAGGRGTRMGGVDKGLQLHRGKPLAWHALQRLAPQVQQVAVNANRNLDTYASFATQIWPDALADHPGPLAGVLTGLDRCATPWLVTVPCDTPGLPTDLVQRLAHAVAADGADLAIAATCESGRRLLHPVFCLVKRSLAGSLRAYLAAGNRQMTGWTAQQHAVEVLFDDPAAFFNANTLAELQQLQG